MYKSVCLFLVVLAVSCNSGMKQPKVLETGCGFNLENLNFNEDVPLLYSKNIMSDRGTAWDSVYDGEFSDTLLKYRLSDWTTRAMKFKVPVSEFGYLYKCTRLDSVARFQNIYFDFVSTLTDTAKKPVAYYAETEIDSLGLKKRFLDEFRNKYGSPRYEFSLSRDFNQCSYEWILDDRTIQIKTSHGFRASFSSNGKTQSGRYYRMEMLIVENKSKKSIYNAHVFEVPDSINYEGKKYCSTDLMPEKELIVEDKFLLISTNKIYLKDEYGMYNISNAEKEE